MLEALGVTLSRDTRARAIQLPAWNEALGLPRPWDQQWSLRMQQVLAYETDLLEYGDIFEGSHVVDALTAEIEEASWVELQEIVSVGGAFHSVDTLKTRLVASQQERVSQIASGERPVVGVNAFTETEPSFLAAAGGIPTIVRVDPAVEDALRDDLVQWRRKRDGHTVDRALDALRRSAGAGVNVMDPTIELALAGGTTGEWAGALRETFGDYRAPTGIASTNRAPAGPARRRELDGASARTGNFASRYGRAPRMLVAKPGLDGHSNGAEQVALAARDAGFEVIYQGIRSTPAQIAQVARDEDVDIVGISILSGSHMELVPEIIRLMREMKVAAPVVVGGIVPDGDVKALVAAGVSRVYTPKDFLLGQIMSEMADLAEQNASSAVPVNVPITGVHEMK